MNNNLYLALSIAEVVLIVMLLLGVIKKKKFLVTSSLIIKILIHGLVSTDIFIVMNSPLLYKSFITFMLLIIKQLVYIVIIVLVIYMHQRMKFRNAFILMITLLCVDLVSVTIFYPQFINLYSSISGNNYLTTSQSLWLLSSAVTAPFNSISYRFTFTITEVILFGIQWLKFQKENSFANT
ncbi:MAG: hypothetical protein E7191_03820 [Erysipelotrichaceae bacterium]|nr:hypothetical protein [Erysipelotrichaceae bacterium]